MDFIVKFKIHESEINIMELVFWYDFPDHGNKLCKYPTESVEL